MGSHFNREEKFTSMYNGRSRIVTPKVLLLFYGFVLVIPPQLRSVLNMNQLYGISGLLPRVFGVCAVSAKRWCTCSLLAPLVGRRLHNTLWRERRARAG